MNRVGVRWTVGDVSPHGFEALRLSAWGVWRLFGRDAEYAIVVNGVAPDDAARRAAPLPPGIRVEPARGLPPFLRARLDAGMAEGVAWKFAPVRVFPGMHELALDNDCVLWDVPAAVRRWIERRDAAVLAEDVRLAFGRFAPACGDAPRNTGIRGLPPGFDLEAALDRALARHDGALASELDEQGLQVAAVLASLPVLVIGLDEVTICSPFPPHLSRLGTCGAHFVGLNARSLGWTLGGRRAEEWTREHFERLRPDVEARVGLRGSPAVAP
jgi:hypothetical protein